MKRRRIIIVLFAFVLLGAIGGIFWARSLAPPQIITLPDGQQFQFMGVTYGTNHVKGSLAARVVNHLPRSLANFVRKHLGLRLWDVITNHSTEPELIVWFHGVSQGAAPTNWPREYFQGHLYGDGEVGGQEVRSDTVGAWGMASFQLVPRRSRLLECWLYFGGEGTNGFRQFSFPNPLYGHFPQWQPEPVPATKRLSDLEVRLNKFDPEPEMDTYLSLDFRSLKTTNEIWEIQSAEMSDATGNRIRVDPASRRSQFNQTDGTKMFRGTLWPDEAAWRLRFDFKRKSDFAAEELVTFKNVPVLNPAATNTILLTNMVGGVTIVLREFMIQPGFEKVIAAILAHPVGGVSLAMSSTDAEFSSSPKFDAEIPGKPDGWSVDLVRVTTSVAGELNSVQVNDAYYDDDDVQWPNQPPAHEYRYFAVKPVPTNVQTVDITWAVQKTRTVEFFVRPPKEKWDLQLKKKQIAD